MKMARGNSKRKIISPLQKDGGKSRRTDQDDVVSVSDVEEVGGGLSGQKEDRNADLKEFIRSENARSNKELAEEIG